MDESRVMALLLQYAEALGAARSELLHIALTSDDSKSRGNASAVYDQTGELINVARISRS